jgi:hypothetical protein
MNYFELKVGLSGGLAGAHVISSLRERMVISFIALHLHPRADETLHGSVNTHHTLP